MFTKYVAVNINHITLIDNSVQVGNSQGNEFEIMNQKLETQRKEYELKISQMNKEMIEMKQIIQQQQQQQQQVEQLQQQQQPSVNSNKEYEERIKSYEEEILAIKKDFDALNEYTTNLESNTQPLNDYLKQLEFY